MNYESSKKKCRNAHATLAKGQKRHQVVLVRETAHMKEQRPRIFRYCVHATGCQPNSLPPGGTRHLAPLTGGAGEGCEGGGGGAPPKITYLKDPNADKA